MKYYLFLIVLMNVTKNMFAVPTLRPGADVEGKRWDCMLHDNACCRQVSGSGLPRIKAEQYPSYNEIPSNYEFDFVTREQWRARTPNQRTNLTTPVPYVVIHHSYEPAACYNRKDCERAMRSMQNYHMDKREWWDIGYNFAVGSDGTVYEGRGWTTLGAHALHFNTVSMGICLIGDWTGEVPPSAQLETTKALIKVGVRLGYLRPAYRLVGHRQVRATECPGEALFHEITTWDHYSPRPASVRDLPEVRELPQGIKDLLKTSTEKA